MEEATKSLELEPIKLEFLEVLLVALQAAIVNHYIVAIKLWERALFVICVVAIIGYFIT